MEDIYEEMEDSTDPLPLAKGLSPRDSGWLALLIRRKCAASRETNQEVIARELDVCFVVHGSLARSVADYFMRVYSKFAPHETSAISG